MRPSSDRTGLLRPSDRSIGSRCKATVEGVEDWTGGGLDTPYSNLLQFASLKMRIGRLNREMQTWAARCNGQRAEVALRTNTVRITNARLLIGPPGLLAGPGSTSASAALTA